MEKPKKNQCQEILLVISMNRKRAIFSYCNFQIHKVFPDYQKAVIDKFNIFMDVDYKFLSYNAPDGEVFPDNAIDLGLKTLFYEEDYTDVLILDIDCIPLTSNAIHYTFEKTAEGYLIGNVQRSHHLQNSEHLFCGASCVGLSRETFDAIGRPSSKPTNRSDICEEFTWICEDKNIPIEFYVPDRYEDVPFTQGYAWELDGKLKPYGIGTTFVNSKGVDYFYHLFESRTGLHVEKFLKRAKALLD